MTLNNRLAFILSVCSLMMGCAPKSKQTTKVAMTQECKETNVLVRERHLVISAKSQKQGNLVECFKHYLKFQKDKEQLLQTCTELVIKRTGAVRSVQTISRTKETIPKDFKWCLEQEFWKMDFAALQLDRDYQIVFPLNFSSIKE